MYLAVLLNRAALPLDAARRAALGLAFRDRRVARFVTDRDTRLSVIATGHAAIAFVLAVFVPTLLVVLGPVLLGVIHVAADVRYLVLRRSLPRWWQLAIFCFCAALIGVRVLAETHVLAAGLDRAELALVTAWVLVGLCSGAAASRSPARAAAGAVLVAAVAFVAFGHPKGARLVFAHVHNLVALVLWTVVFRRRASTAVLPVAIVLGSAALLSSGALYGVTMHHGLVRAFGVHIFQAADWLAPVQRAELAVGLTCSYAFLQSVHYVVWLGLIPQDDATGRGLSSFHSSFISLRRDFGTFGLALVGVAVVAVLAGALFDAPRARGLYLSLSLFHGYLELSLLAYFTARGRLPLA